MSHTLKFKRWFVMRVNDDGRAERVIACRNYDEAAHQAGYLRDHMEEDDVGAGWNYLPRQD